MGHIRRLDSNADPQAFPGALFEIAGEVPLSQCSEATLEGDHGISIIGNPVFRDNGKFAGYNLEEKFLNILSPPANVGSREIDSNGPDTLLLDAQLPASSSDNVYYISDGPQFITARNAQSFAEYIHAAGHAYTIKGGKLYTDMPNDQIKNACTILFDPLP